jgi:hypothetical protein
VDRDRKGTLMRLFKKDPEREAAQSRYVELLAGVAAGPAGASLLPELGNAAQAADLSGRKQQQFTDQALNALASGVLEDEVLSRDEESYVLEVIDVLGIPDDVLQSRYLPVMKQFVLGRANDGRLPIVDDPRLMAQRDEVVHQEVPAALIKEVAVREYRGASSGVSFRVAKGVRLHTGRQRGKMVTVGTEIQTVDSGVLSITSKRVVFSGQRKTIESKYAKLVGLQVFSDALAISVSNRQANSTFRVDDGPFTAALINAAAQQCI